MEYAFTVTTMTCGHCEAAVRNAVLAADPKADVQIDRSQNSVVIRSELPPTTLVAAITEEGYTVAG